MKLRHYILLIIFSAIFASCHRDEPVPPHDKQYKRTVLIYAIASNSLQTNIIDDRNEILQWAPEMDTEKFNLVIYSVTRQTMPELYQLKVENGVAHYEVLKTYDREIYSTNPERMKTVFADVQSMFPSEDYGLIMWSHSTAWLPSSNWSASSSAPMAYSFGEDSYNGRREYTEVTQLRDAIPDNVFSFIWFDSCYMSNIETAYELRGKCDTYIGYATEIWDEGSPYHLIMPYIMKEEPDFPSAIKASYEYFQLRRDIYTGCVIDMRKIEDVAAATHKLLYGTSKLRNTSGLQRYSRSINPVLYDFGQYVRRRALENASANDDDARAAVNANIAVFDAALADMVIYKVASERNFSNDIINPENYCGLTASLQDPEGRYAEFYKTLAWYKAIYE